MYCNAAPAEWPATVKSATTREGALLTERLLPVDGMVTARGPGLGLDWDEHAVARYAFSGECERQFTRAFQWSGLTKKPVPRSQDQLFPEYYPAYRDG
jgi:hypothetical protein